MGNVSQYLRELIARQIKEHGIVVWFEPDEHFREFIRDCEIPDTKVFGYEGSFFALRHMLEPFFNGLELPRLLIYVPLAEAATHHALAEFAAAGVVVQPGQQPPTRNTRLSVLARNALKPLIGEQAAGAIEKQVESNKLSLADLDRVRPKNSAETRWRIEPQGLLKDSRLCDAMAPEFSWILGFP
jgi:hypothetical protein